MSEVDPVAGQDAEGETPPQFDWRRMQKERPDLYRRLVYEVARLFDAGKTHEEIVRGVYLWAKEYARDYYDSKGEPNLAENWAGRHIVKARSPEFRFLQLAEFTENTLLQQIQACFPTSKKIHFVLAPDPKTLLRQAWLAFDEILVQKAKSTPAQPVIVSVSGGRTMLQLARAAPQFHQDMRWHKPAVLGQEKRERVALYSLTSGGVRDNIEALSDTVAATIARELGVKAHGLLGPAVFHNGSARAAFCNDPEVQKHIQQVHESSIILTSIGYVGGRVSLTRQVLRSIDSQCTDRLLEDHPHLADVLYDCIDGHTGEPVDLPRKIVDRLFSVLSSKQLSNMVQNQGTRCIVVANGYDKGYHALRGVIMKRMASDIHLDIDCARGLIDTCQ